MKLGAVLAGATQLILLLGVTAFADPTYSVYSDPPVPDGSSIRYGMNDFGAYVGWTFSGGTYYGFVLGTDGTTSAVTPPSAVSAHATGINDSNVIVGYFTDASGIHGFINAGSSYTTLNAPGATATYAYGINKQGQVVGYYIDAQGVTHGFVEYLGVFTTIDVPDAIATYGLGINEQGEIVGSYFDGTAVHGFISRGGIIEVVDYPDASVTWVTSIDRSGTLKGWSRSCPTCEASAFFENANGFFSLPDMTNDWGFNGSLLRPGREWTVSSPVPEPGTLSLAACGALTLVLARRFRKKQ